ncbi:CCCH zinc finger dna binding protein [Coniochaeta hoffmannii]|uniref:CCCH zinc finger dna binding protein n=1 Tax=Coniochaeta hoffmannii TaxID=91930 RepID=A0AA38RFF4_9PEZI|nr:CCCH zinc finger dna binding protein [Coniochaeta hoffmannii]
MASTAGVMDFIQRYQALRAYQDNTDQLLTDLLLYVQQIETAVRKENEVVIGRLHHQLEDAAESGRELLRENQRLEQIIANTRGNGQYLQVEPRNVASTISERDIEALLQKHNPYVLVLIDGNGLLFKEHYVKRGIDGGRKAAQALKAAILKQCHGLATEIEVIAKVCVNLAGLAQAMQRDGSLDNESQLKDFAVGFTRAVASFDFIDVGSGSADVKIQEATTWHLKNYNCKHIILGVSHDAKHATFVDGLMHDETTMGRVTILEGVPTVRELTATGIHVLNLTDTLFRSERLVANPPPLTIAPLPPPVASPRPAPVAAAPRPASTPAVPPPSYAKAIKSASPPPKMSLPIPLQPKPAAAQRQVAQVSKSQAPPWNPGPRGLDSPLNVSQAALDNVKKRKDSDKLCNNHYLRGPCSKGDDCCFEHKYKPTNEEVVAIAYLTRLNPCTAGQDCDVDNCIYGHHCPTVRDGRCTHPNCKFLPEQHPPGTILRKKSNNGYEDY